MKKFIWETSFAKFSDYSSSYKSIVKYLTQNRAIVLPEQVLEPIFQVKPYTKTITTELFERCINTGFIEEFASLYPSLQGSDVSIPDGLATPELVYDLKNNKESLPLASYSELNNKLLVNVSGLLKQNNQTRQLIVSDINELHSMYVRSMLVRSFSCGDGWLTPNLATYIVKVYSLCFGGLIGKNENLSFQEQMTVSMILALYMSQQFAKNDDDPARPRNFFKCTFLGPISDLENIMARASERAREGLTLDTVAELISETGPQRLRSFNLGSLYRIGVLLGSSLSPVTTRIALEYAPYFTYMLINVLSGGKGGAIHYKMKENRLIGTESKRFIDELKVCQSLYSNR